MDRFRSPFCKTITEVWSIGFAAKNKRGKPAMTEVSNDQRIIREDYRNYDLIARYWDGCYRGRLFRQKERIADIEGEDLDAIVQELRNTVDALVHERQKQRKKEPTVGEWQAALSALQGKLKEEQRSMLLTHARAEEGTAPLSLLQRAGHYTTVPSAIAHYAAAANRLADEVGYNPPAKGYDPAILSVVLAKPFSVKDALPTETIMLRAHLREALRLVVW
jgi:hypothetical protein